MQILVPVVDNVLDLARHDEEGGGRVGLACLVMGGVMGRVMGGGDGGDGPVAQYRGCAHVGGVGGGEGQGRRGRVHRRCLQMT